MKSHNILHEVKEAQKMPRVGTKEDPVILKGKKGYVIVELSSSSKDE